MKAIRIVGPSQIKIEDIPIAQPANNEVLIEIKASGMCGTDVDLYTNDSALITGGQVKLPLIPGHEWSGQIIKTGCDVHKFKVGDRVTGECAINCSKCKYCINGHPNMCLNITSTGIIGRDGAFAEYLTFPVSHLHKINNLTYEEAALLEPITVALHAVKKSNVEPMQNILVTGPGPIGLITVQLLKNVYGVKKVILSGTRDDRLSIGDKTGADAVINIKKENLEERIKEITDSQMIDTVIETSGGANIFNDLDRIINPLGKIVLVGFFGSKRASIDWDTYTLKEISIITANGSPGMWKEAIEIAERGMLNIKALISHVMHLDDFDKAMQMLIQKEKNVCKIVLTP